MSNVNEKTPISATCVPDAGTRSYDSSLLTPPSSVPSPSSLHTPHSSKMWYPMYVTYSREVLVRDALDKKGVKNFLPMERVTERVGKKLVHSLQPLIHNLIFVYSDRAQLRELKMFNRDCVHMQFMTIKPRNDEQASVVITIPERQMEQFMRAMSVDDELGQRSFLPYTDFLGREGQRIRFLRGPFQGIEGTIKRIRSNRHLVIALPHVGVLVITIPSSRDIEFIE